MCICKNFLPRLLRGREKADRSEKERRVRMASSTGKLPQYA